MFLFSRKNYVLFWLFCLVKAGHTLILKVKGVVSKGHSDQQGTVTQAVCTSKMFPVTSKLEE